MEICLQFNLQVCDTNVMFNLMTNSNILEIFSPAGVLFCAVRQSVL